MPAQVARPSDARRQALSSATDMGEKGVPLVSNFFPLDRYYDAADSVLAAFHGAYEARRLDDAYVYGKRFAIFSLNALPKHNYYNSPRYGKAKLRNKENMADVISKLERVASWMDLEEVEKERERKKIELARRRLEEEKLKKEAEVARLRLMEFERGVQQKQREKGSRNVEQSALDKLRQLGGSQRHTASDPFLNDLQQSFPRRGQSLQKEPSLRNSLQRESSRRGLNSRQSSQSSLSDLNRSGELDGGRRYPRRGSNGGGEDSRAPRRGSNEGRMQRRGSNESDRSRRRGSNEREEVRRRPERRGSGDQPLPPPLAPPPAPDAGFPPPPSYNAVIGTKSHDHGRPTANQFPPSALEQAAAHAAAAGGLSTRREPTVREQFHQSQGGGSVYANRELEKVKRETRTKKEPIRDTRSRARDKFKELLGAKRIHVMPINTHQGRLGQSTNGCAVISPLVVSHHLRSRSAVTDHEIVDVIDRECGPLLREIRGKLGLDGHALIIPSDVHDHLVDKKLLQQEHFVGATGGNVMDRKHLAEFLRLIDSGEKNSHQNKRTGAALFYREHVVSIVKVPLSGGKWCYDLIDSLPGLPDGTSRTASRTRCRDLSAFESYIRYYASNKLSDSNCSYIDSNDWDDSMADFDPRVFQGFVWGDK